MLNINHCIYTDVVEHDRPKNYSVHLKMIGRNILFIYAIASACLIAIILPMIGYIFYEPKDIELSFIDIASTFFMDLRGNLSYVSIQIIVILVAIWLIGGRITELISAKPKKGYLFGAFSIFFLWLVLFISCMLTSAIQKSLEYGLSGFKSASISWIIYGLLPFILFGIIHGLLAGYPLYKSIRTRIT